MAHYKVTTENLTIVLEADDIAEAQRKAIEKIYELDPQFDFEFDKICIEIELGDYLR